MQKNKQAAYTAPTISFCNICLEAGFALSLPSNTIDDWTRDENEVNFN
ncbi:MAG: hypothetical protein IJ348_00225 [Alistipes sp.]|nr:hypothetical protein [Alistipes sp.]